MRQWKTFEKKNKQFQVIVSVLKCVNANIHFSTVSKMDSAIFKYGHVHVSYQGILKNAVGKEDKDPNWVRWCDSDRKSPDVQKQCSRDTTI